MNCMFEWFIISPILNNLKTYRQSMQQIYEHTLDLHFPDTSSTKLHVFWMYKIGFAEEMALARDLAARIETGTNLADLLSSALPPDKCQEKDKDSSGSGEVSESASTSSLGSNSSHSKAPGSQLTHGKVSNPLGFNSQHDLMHAVSTNKQLKYLFVDLDCLFSVHKLCSNWQI